MKKMHGISTKAFAALLAVTLLVGSAIGGTLAWLTADPVSVTNTFTIGNVAITLEETGAVDGEQEFTVIPGVNLAKDPKVTVDSTSEDCWVFVKIEDDGITSSGLTYSVRNGWNQLSSETGVYYREVKNSDSEKEFYVLTGDDDHSTGMITVPENIKTLKTTNPTLKFTAYAVQREGLDNVSDAWDQVKDLK